MKSIVCALYFPVILALLVGGCTEKTSPIEGGPAPSGKEAGVQGTNLIPTPSPVGSDASLRAPASAEPVESDPRKAALAWFRTVLPSGGVATEESGKIVLRHQVAPSETPASIAKLYLPFSKLYLEEDLAEAISKKIAKSAGTIEIPSPIQAKFKSADEERLGWPKDQSLRGIYLGGNFARQTWIETLDKMVARGMNAVVLDAKDYMGPVVYPSKVALALETGATKHAPIRDMARTIRFAHDRGIRIILRISCFHDPFMMKAKPDLSLKYTNGKPAPYEWIDPVNEDAQDYVIDLVKEGIEFGADEIQLDYVRFPVQKGLKWIQLPPHGVIRTELIRDFAKRVHDVTSARKVPLSLDIFGVASTGTREDIEALGQDIELLSSVSEALSPMVYPSHYYDGFMGFDKPGAHAEVVRVGTAAAVKQVETARKKWQAEHPGEKREFAVIRSWLQAFNWNSPGFGPKYIYDQTKEAEKGGGVGWLLWDPSCMYFQTWPAFPKKNVPTE